MVTNTKEISYFSNVYKWVDYLDYPNNWHSFGPFESAYGTNPYTVYKRLFEEPVYYILNEDELKTLRTTIQYKAVYLNDSYNKLIKFFEDLGFITYKKCKTVHNDGRPDWLSQYMKRDNISIWLSNLETPQDYRPNKIFLSPGIFVTSKKTGKRRRKILESVYISVLDELGEKTKKKTEETLSEILKY